MSAVGTLQVATNCFFTALNWTAGKLTVVCARLVSKPELDSWHLCVGYLINTGRTGNSCSSDRTVAMATMTRRLRGLAAGERQVAPRDGSQRQYRTTSNLPAYA
jgi:hypothetical protein